MVIIKVSANIHRDSESQFTGWVKEIRGVMAQGDYPIEVSEMLINKLCVQLTSILAKSKPSKDGFYCIEMTCNTDLHGYRVCRQIKMHG